MNRVIIGDGTVGKALGLAMGVEPLGPGESKVKADVVVICVPTETHGGVHDQSQVEQALSRIEEAKLVIMRSTVLPGTTNRLSESTGWPMVFVPEFGFEATMVNDLANPTHYIIGVDRSEEADTFVKMVKEALPPAPEYVVMAVKSAEFAKYFTNIWGTTQVAMANALYDWVESQGGDEKTYEEAVRGATMHKNVPNWGWRIYDGYGHRGASGKCLPKDTQAMLSQFGHPLIAEVNRFNEELRKR